MTRLHFCFSKSATLPDFSLRSNLIYDPSAYLRPASTYDDDLLQANPNHVGQGWDDNDEDEEDEDEAAHDAGKDKGNGNIGNSGPATKGHDEADEQERDDVETLVSGLGETRI